MMRTLLGVQDRLVLPSYDRQFNRQLVSLIFSTDFISLFT